MNRLIFLVLLSSAIPAGAGTISTQVFCQTLSVTSGGGGINVPSASCQTSGSSASASVTVTGVNVSLMVSNTVVGSNSSAFAQADFDAVLRVSFASPCPGNGQTPCYVKFVLPPTINSSLFSITRSGQNSISCPDFSQDFCFVSGGVFNFHLQADTAPQDGNTYFSGVVILDSNGNLVGTAQVSDITAPEPGASMLMLTGLFAMAAVMGGARPSRV
jgi:hypothetical protein